MKIKVINNNLIIENAEQSILKYTIRKSWDSSFSLSAEYKSVALFKKNIEILNDGIDTITISLPLDPILTYNDLYFIDLIYENGFKETIYVDYNVYHNISDKEKTFEYKFSKEILFNKANTSYKVYLKGNYGDFHKARFLYIKDSSNVLLKVPDIKYESELYDIIVEKNKEEIYRETFPMITKAPIDFSINVKKNINFLQLDIAKKLNYIHIKDVKIFNNNSLIFAGEKFEKTTLYIGAIDKSIENSIVIEYTLYENLYKQKNEIKGKFKYVLNKTESEKIKSVSFSYDPLKDIGKFNIECNKKYNYKLIIGEDCYHTSNKEIVIPEFSKYDSFSEKIGILIKYSDNYFFNHNFEYSFENPMFKYKSMNFNPVIDYSKSLKVTDNFGTITWSKPNFKYYSRIKINVLNKKEFLDEYMNIWNNDRILEKPLIEFDKKYQDYEKLINYDFKNINEYSNKKVNESQISYDLTKDGFIYLGETNSFTIPLWFCEVGSEYKVTVEIYNYWCQKVGERTISFKLYNNFIGEVSEKWLWFDRGQKIQFGETGSVGEYYAISNATPIDVHNAYSPSKKTYYGKALYNTLNTDLKGHSLYFFFSITNSNFKIKYKRMYNFYKFNCNIYKENEKTPYMQFTHIPKGNDYKDNIIIINKNKFKEGRNILKIQTFNADGKPSEEKEYVFTVFSEKPVTPYVKVNNDDFIINDNKEMLITKKRFRMSITNNEQSLKYAGWNFKEAHFYFKKKNALYNDYADYVILASKDDGSIVLNNTVGVENGEYDCKVVAYDYNGNASDPFEFSFKLISEMQVKPHKLFSNQAEEKFKWHILKSQDSEGFYCYYEYSADGYNYTESNPVKVESPYYIDDPTTEREHVLNVNWLTDDGLIYKRGFYRMVVYEYSFKHPEGLSEYKFKSDIVEVNKIANPSNPIFAKKSKTNVVYHEREYNEYSYTSDINSIVFNTIHDENVFDNPATTGMIEGQYYSIELISPDGNNKFSARLPLPKEVGVYEFTNILDLCKISNPNEGIWKLNFITVDKFGNSNASKGYYTYYIVYLKRKPKISSITATNTNGSDIFGLNSKEIGYIVNTNEIYSDIPDYEKHKEKFKINKFNVSINSNPFGTTYKNEIVSHNDKIIVANPLTEDDKVSHIRDGKYSISISCIDPLGRESTYVDKTFSINTALTGELMFVSNKIFNKHKIDIVALVNGNITNVYYTLDKNNDDVKTWTCLPVSDFEHNSNFIHGVLFKNLQFELDGQYCIKYIIEEESTNRSEVKLYYFNIDTEIKLIPIFDYDNKLYYNVNDDNLVITWYATNEDVNDFYYKIDQIYYDKDNTVHIANSYMMPEDGNIMLPVGANKNDFVHLKNERKIVIPLKSNYYFVSGYYQFVLKGKTVYGDNVENIFKFSIDKGTQLDLSYEMINNKVTLDNNVIMWNHIKDANYYEISYDGLNWLKVIDNKFSVNPDRVIADKYGKTYIYMRWRSFNGLYSEISRIELHLSIVKLKTPKVYYRNNTIITEDNKNMEWVVEIDDIPNSKFLYYSFDNKKWNFKRITSSKEIIIDDELKYPVADGRYNIFVRATDDHPNESDFINKSDIAYAFVDVFASIIERPRFSGITNGMTFNLPIKLIIENKHPDVQYFIFVNNTLVPEGYEISNYNLTKYNIVVKAKKNGIERVHNLITTNDEFHIYSKTDEKYHINIGENKVVCIVDSDNNSIEVQSMPNRKNSEVILYKKKEAVKWGILKIGDRLSLDYEWEFKVSSFNIL